MISAVLWAIDVATRELLLFAGVGLLVGGIDDLAIDLIWIGRTLWRRATIYRQYPRATLATLPPPDRPGRIAILIGAWAEGDVIGAMLEAALRRIDHGDYRIYVGMYANDPDTLHAVRKIARQDVRVRPVVGDVHGPTTKAECLNRVWAALIDDEQQEGVIYKAIVLHDAEDVVHPAELALFDRMIERFDMVQLPVLPLIDPHSRWIGGHYCDEFAEAHGRQLVIREALGAGVPSAGVGCAISREAMGRLAAVGNGRPFDEASLTEDYEIGLKLADNGFRGIFARLTAADGGGLIAVRAHFPGTLSTAVRQKTRWMTGIALAGWDRLGWSGGWVERWMRIRDRRAILAALILGAAYFGMIGWLVSVAGHYWLLGYPPATTPVLHLLMIANFALLMWRGGMRFLMVRQVYGAVEGLCAIIRIVPANIISLLAARRALLAYWQLLRGGKLQWDKTTHIFPQELPAE